jgi:hypothetical protein
MKPEEQQEAESLILRALQNKIDDRWLFGIQELKSQKGLELLKELLPKENDPENDPEHFFDIADALLAAQSDRIQPEKHDRPHACDLAKRKDILRDCRKTADKGILADPAELMDTAESTKIGEIIHADVAAESRGIGKNNAVADDAIELGIFERMTFRSVVLDPNARSLRSVSRRTTRITAPPEE